MGTNRNQWLDALAQGHDCPRCGAWASVPCTTPVGRTTAPHAERINRAVTTYHRRSARRD